jgi:uncharacterized protein YaiL (DUF2058 family)
MKSAIQKERSKKLLISQKQEVDAEVDAEIESEKERLTTIKRSLSLKQKRSKELKDKINAIVDNKKITITEHAIVRYFERVCGFDVKKITTGLMSKELESTIISMGGKGEYKCDGYTLVVKNNAIVTIK